MPSAGQSRPANRSFLSPRQDNEPFSNSISHSNSSPNKQSYKPSRQSDLMNDSISTSSASSSTSSIVYNSMGASNYNNASNFNFASSLNSYSSASNGSALQANNFSNNARPYPNNNTSPITNSSPSSSSTATAAAAGNPPNSIIPKSSPTKRTAENRPTDKEPASQRTPTNHSKQLSNALLFPALSEVSFRGCFALLPPHHSESKLCHLSPSRSLKSINETA